MFLSVWELKVRVNQFDLNARIDLMFKVMVGVLIMYTLGCSREESERRERAHDMQIQGDKARVNPQKQISSWLFVGEPSLSLSLLP